MSSKNRKDTQVRVRPALGDTDVRVWLRANGYDDVADQIDQIMVRWKAQGKATRRNWWEILAGDKNGNPRIAGGKKFPILRAARIWQGLGTDVPNLLCRNVNEQAPLSATLHDGPENEGNVPPETYFQDRLDGCGTIRLLRAASPESQN